MLANITKVLQDFERLEFGFDIIEKKSHEIVQALKTKKLVIYPAGTNGQLLQKTLIGIDLKIETFFDKAFEKVDIIITPTSPSVAFKIGEKSDDPIKMYLSDVFTISANLAGIPGMSVPAGYSEGLPVGIQLLGKAFDEGNLLKAAYSFELARGKFNLAEVK